MIFSTFKQSSIKRISIKFYVYKVELKDKLLGCTLNYFSPVEMEREKGLEEEEDEEEEEEEEEKEEEKEEEEEGSGNNVCSGEEGEEARHCCQGKPRYR